MAVSYSWKTEPYFRTPSNREYGLFASARLLFRNITKLIKGRLPTFHRLYASKLAEKLGLKPRQAERILSGLKNKGIIKRTGSNRNGFWEVLADQKL